MGGGSQTQGGRRSRNLGKKGSNLRVAAASALGERKEATEAEKQEELLRKRRNYLQIAGKQDRADAERFGLNEEPYDQGPRLQGDELIMDPESLEPVSAMDDLLDRSELEQLREQTSQAMHQDDVLKRLQSGLSLGEYQTVDVFDVVEKAVAGMVRKPKNWAEFLYGPAGVPGDVPPDRQLPGSSWMFARKEPDSMDTIELMLQELNGEKPSTASGRGGGSTTPLKPVLKQLRLGGPAPGQGSSASGSATSSAGPRGTRSHKRLKFSLEPHRFRLDVEVGHFTTTRPALHESRSSRRKVWVGFDPAANVQAAIKGEPAHLPREESVLRHECQILARLQEDEDQAGIPYLYAFGVNEMSANYLMVSELLGPNLEQLFAMESSKKKANWFDLKTVLSVGLQALRAVNYVHKCDILHRAIKPSNFAVGNVTNVWNKKLIYLVDYGWAKDMAPILEMQRKKDRTEAVKRHAMDSKYFVPEVEVGLSLSNANAASAAGGNMGLSFSNMLFSSGMGASSTTTPPPGANESTAGGAAGPFEINSEDGNNSLHRGDEGSQDGAQQGQPQQQPQQTVNEKEEPPEEGAFAFPQVATVELPSIAGFPRHREVPKRSKKSFHADDDLIAVTKDLPRNDHVVFASLQAHRNQLNATWRDDYCALGYMLVYFLNGGALPWSEKIQTHNLFPNSLASKKERAKREKQAQLEALVAGAATLMSPSASGGHVGGAGVVPSSVSGLSNSSEPLDELELEELEAERKRSRKEPEEDSPAKPQTWSDDENDLVTPKVFRYAHVVCHAPELRDCDLPPPTVPLPLRQKQIAARERRAEVLTLEIRRRVLHEIQAAKTDTSWVKLCAGLNGGRLRAKFVEFFRYVYEGRAIAHTVDLGGGASDASQDSNADEYDGDNAKGKIVTWGQVLPILNCDTAWTQHAEQHAFDVNLRVRHDIETVEKFLLEMGDGQEFDLSLPGFCWDDEYQAKGSRGGTNRPAMLDKKVFANQSFPSYVQRACVLRHDQFHERVHKAIDWERDCAEHEESTFRKQQEIAGHWAQLRNSTGLAMNLQKQTNPVKRKSLVPLRRQANLEANFGAFMDSLYVPLEMRESYLLGQGAGREE